MIGVTYQVRFTTGKISYSSVIKTYNDALLNGFILSGHSVECRSILGVLSNQGCLQLYFRNRFKWTLFADISELWKQYSLENWFSKGQDDFDSFMEAYKRIRITSK